MDKYEEVYLYAYSDGWDTDIRLAHFLWRYIYVVPYNLLARITPHEIYTETKP